MDKLTDLARQIMEKLVDFFDIFDLSFFISGAMVLVGTLLILNTSSGFPVPDWKDGFELAAVVIACYLLGLISFAAGRAIRQTLSRLILNGESTADWFWPAATYHKLLSSEPFDRYVDAQQVVEKDRGLAGAIYTRLWVELRQHDVLKPSYSLIRRYWVLSASYDGMASSLLYWIAVAFVIALNGAFDPISVRWNLSIWLLASGFGIICFLLAMACFREAKRFQKYQVEELVATMAFYQSLSDGSRAKGSTKAVAITSSRKDAVEAAPTPAETREQDKVPAPGGGRGESASAVAAADPKGRPGA